MISTSSSTRHGLPGQLLIEEVLRRQQKQAPRTRLDRLLGRSPITAKNLPWYTGAKGELAVGALLERLPQGWRVLHSLPIGPASDIDHVVVGPGGVFVLNTKHHARKTVWVAGRGLLVDGQRTPYIRRAEREGLHVLDALACAGVFGTQVTPMIVLVGVASLTIREEPAVPVLRAERLVSWLRTQPVRMEEEVVDELARRLTRPGIWAEIPDSHPDASVRFAALDAEVGHARIVRQTWKLAVALGTVAVAFALVQAALGALTASLVH
jgi:hypothetical protein